MSDDREQEEKELKEMEQQLTNEKEKREAQAATALAEPEPAASNAPDSSVVPSDQLVGTSTPAPSNDEASPLEWANKKGLTSPEAIARSLQNMEQEFHKRNQQGHPGYADLNNGNPAPMPPPPPPNWNPGPQGYPPAPGYGYPPPPPQRQDISRSLAQRYGMDPEDVERLMPMVVDAAEAIASRRTSGLEREFAEVRRQSARNSELMSLAQDPAFSDPRVQKEMHEVLKDGSLFQRERAPYVAAFQIAMTNLARKQLQQGVPSGYPTSGLPPTTANGGNGSAYTGPRKITEAEFNGWSSKDQEAFINSNGRMTPKK